MSEIAVSFLKIEEAARILRISRSAAYEQANAYLATKGATGLPVIRLGRSIRVPGRSSRPCWPPARPGPTPPETARHWKWGRQQRWCWVRGRQRFAGT
jgi:hypothetical protein